MSNKTITYVVAAGCGALALIAWLWPVRARAGLEAYSHWWERIAATFLTLYVLAALLVVGGLGGALIAYYWDGSRLARRAASGHAGAGLRSLPDSLRSGMPTSTSETPDTVDLDALDAITERRRRSAPGLPEVVRAAAQALDASLVLDGSRGRRARGRRALAARTSDR